MTTALWLSVLAPLVLGCIALWMRKNPAAPALALAGAAANFIAAVLFWGRNASATFPWVGFGMDLAFRIDRLSGFIYLAAALMGLLIAIYTVQFLGSKLGTFHGYLLISLGFINGAVLADNLIAMLFFWEGLLVTLYAMIAMGRPGAFRTAIKAFVIVGVTDLCMMVGIGLAGASAGTFQMSQIHLAVQGSGLAFVLLVIGAAGKSGSMPFHTWIPDAAGDAPMPFMALFPGAMEKLVGIYFLTRVSFHLFELDPHSWASTLLMILGGVTLLFAVMMALVQKDYKRLLSYHAISQVGYMILGIGTALPIGIAAGLFHMINNAFYKSALFLTAGSVEKQTGTTDLRKLGGLRSAMPWTAGVFVVCALSISGVPPFNGFFSKELIYDAALERSWVFYLIAAVGSFFTAASFLKLGHAVFFGPKKPEHDKVHEASAIMLIPMVVISALCVLFGLGNAWVMKHLLVPAVGGEELAHHAFTGLPSNWALVAVTLVVLAGAAINHFWGVRKSGSGVGAVDHIHHAPVLHAAYDKAEKRAFDPYEWGRVLVKHLAADLNRIDRAVDWLTDGFVSKASAFFAKGFQGMQSGRLASYIVWTLVGAAVVLYWVL